MADTFLKQRTGNRDIDELLDNLAEALEPVLGQANLKGRIIEDVVIGTSATVVNHRLGRTPIAAIPVLKNADARVWWTAKGNRTITLVASAEVTANLWVF